MHDLRGGACGERDAGRGEEGRGSESEEGEERGAGRGAWELK